MCSNCIQWQDVIYAEGNASGATCALLHSDRAISLYLNSFHRSRLPEYKASVTPTIQSAILKTSISFYIHRKRQFFKIYLSMKV